MAESTLLWLQNWYLSHCNGDWEHQQGIEIGTLDNPGWRLEINLIGTPLEGVAFDKIEIKRSERDWLVCEVTANTFKAHCGPKNLAEAIECFRVWNGALRGNIPLDKD